MEKGTIEKLDPSARILLVEDEDDLYDTEMILEFNGYQVITAKNGKEGLEKLANFQQPPDLVISDIMMSEMNGYELFREISKHSPWNLVPFILLTAKSSPEDVRFGKTLGADDYLIKPFTEEDLLASVAGKIARSKNHREASNYIRDNLLAALQPDPHPQLSGEMKESAIMFLMIWDETIGSELKAAFPPSRNLPFNLGRLGVQLFQASASVYGPERYYEAKGVLLPIVNINMDGYLFFDTVRDEGVRGGRRQFMLSLLAPKINSLESLRIKEFFEELSARIKNGGILFFDEDSCRECWEKIIDILTSPVLDAKYLPSRSGNQEV